MHDIAVQTLDLKFEPRRSEAEHATSRLQRFSTILTQSTRDLDPMLISCWSPIYDADPSLKQHWVDAPAIKH